MDNHKGAFAFWESLGVRGATCIHVDAHLDASNFQVPEPGELEHPELNCGSWLYPAMRDGMISHLVWLLPPHLPGDRPFLDWARRELQNWMWLTLDEYRSLRLEEGRVEGTMAGARLTLCTLEYLPPLEGALIDIDIDYFFLADDSVWQTPLALCDGLPRGDPVTIATSIEGGYTPPQYRYIGELCRLALTGERAEAERWWDALQRRQVPADAPAWCRAAQAALQGQWDAAAAIDPDYRRRPMDVAGYFFQRSRYSEMDPWLDDSETGQYLRGLKLWRQDDPSAAEGCWRPLTQLPAAQGLLGGHLHDLIGKVCMEQQRWAEAKAAFTAATRCVPDLASLWRQLGWAQARCGEAEAAARSWRRALALAPDQLPNLPVRLALAQHYLQAGQFSLARTELRHVASQDEGALAAKARLLLMELEARRG
ncbi:MAG: hypothetical protein ACYCW6_14825 [Candidatus Xenobia bacterium]